MCFIIKLFNSPTINKTTILSKPLSDSFFQNTSHNTRYVNHYITFNCTLRRSTPFPLSFELFTPSMPYRISFPPPLSSPYYFIYTWLLNHLFLSLSYSLAIGYSITLLAYYVQYLYTIYNYFSSLYTKIIYIISAYHSGYIGYLYFLL